MVKYIIEQNFRLVIISGKHVQDETFEPITAFRERLPKKSIQDCEACQRLIRDFMLASERRDSKVKGRTMRCGKSG